MTNLLPIALSYLSRGWSVIPVGVDKRPLILWKEFQSRLATPEELVKWFTDFPDAQIGIVTGRLSNLTVVDVESDGDFNFVKDETYLVETGGKGRHYYFEYESDFKNAVKIFPSVDIRSEGGYVVSPSSKTQKGAYTVLKDQKVARMSDQTRNTFKTAKNAVKELPWYATPVETQYPKAEDGLEYEGCALGSRNDSMTKFAGLIHARFHRTLWASIGWKTFCEANKKNTPPLSDYELRVIWNSISTREIQQHPNGRDYTSGLKTWGPDPSIKDTVQEGDQENPDSTETLHVSDVADAQVIDTDHTYPIDMPPFDEALLGGFTAGDLVVVAGQSGHGKTTLIQDWSITLSSGGQSKREKLPSLWFSYEVLARPLWQKFQAMGATKDVPIYMPRFNETGDINWVIDVIDRAIEQWKIKVVCIDHLGFLKAPKGNYANAADAITNTVRMLKKVAVKKGLIILLPVHVRKTLSKVPTLDDIKDSSGIPQEADNVFFVGREKSPDGLLGEQTKLWLIKNRKTGNSASAMFDFQFGRYFYNANDTKKKKDSEDVPDPDTAAALDAFNKLKK